MSSELFDRYKDLQAYVGWNVDDDARVGSAAKCVEAQAHLLIDDFYEEIERHPTSLRVITGGHAQITRLKGSLRAWLTETLEGPRDAQYVERRWKIGLHPAYTRAAMARLRNGLVRILAGNYSGPAVEFCQLVQSFNKLLDLDLA